VHDKVRVTGLGVAREQRVEHVGAQGRLLRQLEYERLVDDQHAVAIQLVGANGPAALDHTKGLERDPHGPGARSLKAQIEGCEPERGGALLLVNWPLSWGKLANTATAAASNRRHPRASASGSLARRVFAVLPGAAQVARTQALDPHTGV
jgi:hypothetical protein